MSLDIVLSLDTDTSKRLCSPDNLNGYIINHRFYFLEKSGAETYGLIYLVLDKRTGAQ